LKLSIRYTHPYTMRVRIFSGKTFLLWSKFYGLPLNSSMRFSWFHLYDFCLSNKIHFFFSEHKRRRKNFTCDIRFFSPNINSIKFSIIIVTQRLLIFRTSKYINLRKKKSKVFIFEGDCVPIRQHYVFVICHVFLRIKFFS
jgi:hypothetical protein